VNSLNKETNPWDYFDRIYCISLQESEDRRRSAREEFAKVGLKGKVEFILVKRHPANVLQGMYESHMSCLRKGLEAGAQNIVVFEDDVGFERFSVERLKGCIEYLAKNPDWKVFLFGALIRSSKKTDSACVQEVRYQSLAHAYVLNRPYAQELAYQPWQGLANDTLFCPLTKDIYAVYPMFAFQKDFASGNDLYKGLEKFRRLLGGLKRIQKATEFYHRHKFGIYAAQVIFILIVVIYLFWR